VILATDEAALYLHATTMRAWAPRGQAPVVRADPGRTKTSFYGTLDLHTGQVVATQATTLNATATAAHLEQVLQTHPDVPILLLWDRAPWHRGAAIRDVLAAHPRLEILLFRVAAPDLNPHEQGWKATRQALSHNHTTATLPDLADQFEAHLMRTTFPTAFLEHRGFYNAYPVSNC
jgi:transposase